LSPGFLSNILFIEDLIRVSEILAFADPKLIALRSELKKRNEHLPAAVYIPFFNNSIRHYMVLNIVTDEAKVFSTKERAPFYMCLEI